MSNESKQSKPDCPLIGQDGNIFNLVGIASRTLKRNGLSEEATEMTSKAFKRRIRQYNLER
jgi:acyl-[acyl carrier protein]--UDP-N-acetylglucosamine O-acyltransferase